MKKANPKAPKRKNKEYIPDKKHNPAILGKKIELLNLKIEKNNTLNELREKALYNHIKLMTNFASHDLKNAIHNIDGYISTLDLDSVQESDIVAIKALIEGMRKSLKDFTFLAPDQTKNMFTLFDYCNSIELLNRGILNENNITFQLKYDKDNNTFINQSLHNIIQITNNLIINSVKALENQQDKIIILIVELKDKFLNITFKDNGCGISTKIVDKIFSLHFSTTGGSGIGLAHAKYIIDDIPEAEIKVSINDSTYTIFNIKIPI